jgi:hypothetical protein
MTITPGTYRATVRGWADRIVTHVSDTAVTFHRSGEADRTITITPVDWGVWVYVAQARVVGE